MPSLNPAFSRNGMMNEPKQQSTWRPTLRRFARAPSSGMGSCYQLARRCEEATYDSAIWKVWCWTDNHNCVRVDSSLHSCNFSFPCFLVNWDDMKFDVEVFWCFPECCVGWRRDDPETFINWHFLAKEEAAYISGLVIPLVTRAQSRWVLTDIRIDSVPPEVAAEVSIISQAEVIWLTCASAIRPVEPWYAWAKNSRSWNVLQRTGSDTCWRSHFPSSSLQGTHQDAKGWWLQIWP